MIQGGRPLRLDRTSRSRGQATVEFALIIPLVLVVLLGVVQVAAVAYAQLVVTHAAREAARTLVVNPAASLDDLRESSDAEFDIAIVPTDGGSAVRVVARHELDPISPLFAAFLDGRSVQSQAQMSLE